MYKKILQLTFLFFITLFISCEPEMKEDEIFSIGRDDCRRQPKFISDLGFNPKGVAFSTSQSNIKGIALIQISSDGKSIEKIYQDSTWGQFGHLGSITTDDSGNVYTVPIPFVNTLENSLSTIHNIYQINYQTGKLQYFTQLPKIDSIAGLIPFGILGLYFDCHGKKLYAASVGGSSAEKDNGTIYAIDYSTKKIIDQFSSKDAMALFVSGVEGSKKLYYGLTRSSDIYSIALSKDGHFKGKAEKAFSLDGLGPRGNDRARRIRMTSYGALQVYGVDFSYNLAAQADKLESLYEFIYNFETHTWNFSKLVY